VVAGRLQVRNAETVSGGPAHQEDLVRTVAATGVRDERVLAAFRKVPRELFVPPELVERAYVDEPLPIPHRQVTTQPSLVAKMVEALEIRGDERVLEIGTGHGFQTALLAELAAFVWSVERWPDLAETGRDNLARFGTENAEVVVRDGSTGLSEHAPYEAIIVSAAAPEVPDPLAAQLGEGGRVVHPVGRGGNERVVLFEKRDGHLHAARTVTGAYFVPLIGRFGSPGGKADRRI
jgi:protein-L-isoaspartate(D-aspartate) O-methyltransferase